MRIVNMYEAKATLSHLVQSVLNGEEIVIANSGNPKVKLVKYHQSADNGFRFGVMRGEITISPDFDAPLPEEVLTLFEAGDSM